MQLHYSGFIRYAIVMYHKYTQGIIVWQRDYKFKTGLTALPPLGIALPPLGRGTINVSRGIDTGYIHFP